MDDRERLLILNMVGCIGSVRLRNLLKHFGSLSRIFQAKEKELKEVKDIGPVIAEKITQSLKKIDIKKELRLIKKHGVEIISFLDERYPENLKNIYDPPIVLYVKGDILAQDRASIAIVGSRLASFYGLNTAERLAFELASRGLTIISGLARGIDSSAHKGALKAKGRTLAVLGSGIANIYPEEHAPLADKISGSGALISEFAMTMPPEKKNFPCRNRIISGLSLGVVVVEAAQKSGALITSDIAMEQGRDVFAVPGKVDSVTSKGTNSLIKQGAKLAETADDIMEELNLQVTSSPKGDKKDKKNPTGQLDKDEVLVYNLLSNEPRHIDELAEASGISVSGISKVLLNLEMRKFTRQMPGKNFIKI